MKKLLLSLIALMLLIPANIAFGQDQDSTQSVLDGFVRSGYATWYNSGIKVRNSSGEDRLGVMYFDLSDFSHARENATLHLNLKAGTPAVTEYYLWGYNWDRNLDGNPVYDDLGDPSVENGYIPLDTIDLTGVAVGEYVKFEGKPLAEYIAPESYFGGEVCFIVTAAEGQNSDLNFFGISKDAGTDSIPALVSHGAQDNSPLATFLSDDVVMYAGVDYELEIGLVGTAPFTVVYNDGTADHTVNTSEMNHVVTLSPTETTTYTLVSATDATGAMRLVDTEANATVNVQTAVLTGSGKHIIANDQDSVFLSVAMTGVLPYTFTLSDGTSYTMHVQSDTTIKKVPGETKVYRIISANDALTNLSLANISGFVTVSLATADDATVKDITDDTFIEQGAPTAINNAATELKTRVYTGYYRWTIFQADISDMTEAVDFAAIGFANTKVAGNPAVTVHAVTEAVDVTTLNYDIYTAGPYTETPITVFDMDADSTLFHVDISQYVNSQIAAGNTNATIIMISEKLTMISAENDETELRPKFYTEASTVSSDDKNDLLSFDVTGLTGPALIDLASNTVTAEVDAGIDVTSLAPSLTASPGATIDPASGASVDFTLPVEYTVTSASGIPRVYTVTITQYVNLEGNDILSWDFNDINDRTVVDAENAMINVKLPMDSDPSALTATYTISDSATISPDPAVATDYSADVEFSVSSEAGTDKTWTVHVEIDTSLILTPVIDGFVVSKAAHAAKCFTYKGYGDTYTYGTNWLKVKSNMDTASVDPDPDIRPAFMFFDGAAIDLDSVSTAELSLYYAYSENWTTGSANTDDITSTYPLNLYTLDFYYPRNPDECFTWEGFPVIGWKQLATYDLKPEDKESYITFSSEALADEVEASRVSGLEMFFFVTMDTTLISNDTAAFFMGGMMEYPPLLNLTMDEYVDPGSVDQLDVNSLKLYPNPSSGQLFVESEAKGVYQLLSISGQLVRSGILEYGKNEVYIGDLENGVYLYRYQSGSNTGTYKVIKQ